MTVLSILSAEAILDELIDRALAGQEICIDCGDAGLVKLIPYNNIGAE